MSNLNPSPSATLRERTGFRTVIVALLAALLATLTPGVASSGELTRVIVAAAGDLAGATAAVAAYGGDVVADLAPFGMVTADVPEERLGVLNNDTRIATVTLDVPLRVQSAGFDATEVAAAAATVNAPAAWEAGYTGDGVGVVLVDTGIAPHPDVADRIAAAIDLTTENNGVDGYGHGTFLAGLVAGNGASSDGRYAGVAPDAHLVSVKVADATGATDLSTILQGLVAADRARELFDAPIVALALSAPAGEVPDPVMLALEMLWARGSVVIVAAGNDGPGAGTVGTPGADPYVITVGAIDDNSTADRSDDTYPTWSAQGPTRWGHTKPELAAPGVSTVGLRAPGSTIDRNNPSAVVDDSYFKGTGTSMATAVAAGAAAVLLQAQPGLTPNEVKGRLMGSAAATVASANPNEIGSGLIDAAAAVASTAPAANADLAPLPTPVSAKDAEKALKEAAKQDKKTVKQAVKDAKDAEATAEQADAAATGKNAKAAAKDAAKTAKQTAKQAEKDAADLLAPAGWSWTGWSWTGWSWTSGDWAGWSWTDEYWAGWSWTGWSWTSGSFDADPTGWSWTGWSWTGDEWAGWSWTGWSWTGDEWAGWSWTNDDWSGWSWTGWSWTGWTWTGWTWTGMWQ